MKIFNLHFITDRRLKQMLEGAKNEQRRLDGSIVSKLTEDNTKLSLAYRLLKGSKR